MTQNLTEITFILLLILANGLFAMSEIALVSARKVRLQQRAAEGNAGAQAALELAETPNRMLSTIQVGITLIGILSGAFAGATLANSLAGWLAGIPWLAPYSQALSLAVVVIAITYLSLVAGELIPKRLALGNPERIAMAMARPMKALSGLASPLVRLLSASTDLGLRLLGVKQQIEPPITEEEIKVLIEQGTQSGVFKESEQDIVEGVFRFADRTVDSIMTPHTEITWLDLEDPFEENLKIVIESQHSLYPVARASLDDCQGVLQARDLLASNLCGEQVDLTSLLKAPLFVPESMPALKALEEIKKSGSAVALVIDEYSGVVGMVTLFDILDAIVGDIPGEWGDLEPQAVQRPDGSWLLDGFMRIDDLKELLNLKELPDEGRVGYLTLGGFVMSQIGSIPRAGQSFRWGDLSFEVMDMDGRRVDKVLVIPRADAGAGEP